MTSKTNENTKESYIGPNKVLAVSVMDEKTPQGNDIVRVIYAGDDLSVGTPSVMPLRTFELLVSETPRDWNSLRNAYEEKVVQELAAIVLEWDIAYEDINSLIMSFTDKLYAGFDRATNYLWTKDDRNFIPGKSAIAYRTLLDANRVLEGIKNDKGTTGQTKADA